MTAGHANDFPRHCSQGWPFRNNNAFGQINRKLCRVCTIGILASLHAQYTDGESNGRKLWTWAISGLNVDISFLTRVFEEMEYVVFSAVRISAAVPLIESFLASNRRTSCPLDSSSAFS